MNLQNLQDNYPKLISYMETNGYSKTYIDRIKREIKKILSAKNSKKVSSYTDIYQEYTKTSSSHRYLRDKRTIIGVIKQFDVHGRYPTEDAGMNFLKEALIRCWYLNSNPSLTFTAKQKRNVEKNFPPFIGIS